MSPQTSTKPKNALKIIASLTLFLTLTLLYQSSTLADDVVLASKDSVNALNDQNADSGSTHAHNNNGVIEGYILADNYNFEFDPDDWPIPCASVSLTPDANIDLGAGLGQPLFTFTDNNGFYQFSGLPTEQNTYSLKMEGIVSLNFNGYAYEPDLDLNGVTTVTLDKTTSSLSDLNFGISEVFIFTFLGSIYGTIWGDDDGSGGDSVTLGDSPLSNIVVTLLPPSDMNLGAGVGMPITDTTDIDGIYLFENLPYEDMSPQPPSCESSGTYTVTVDLSTVPDTYSPIPNYDLDNVMDGETITTLTTRENLNAVVNFSFPPLTVTSVELSEVSPESPQVLLAVLSLMLFVAWVTLLIVRKSKKQNQ